MVRLGLCVLLAVFACFGQTRITTDSVTITLCWDAYPDAGATYLVYYKNYGVTDTNWYFITNSTTPQCNVTKNSKKNVIFGVKTVLIDDTSDIHSSLDPAACLSGTCAVTCTSQGPWYLQWKLRKTRNITVKKPW
jgi:hypothetical protein